MKNFNTLWITLLAVSGATALWLSSLAVFHCWQYFRLNAHAEVESIAWTIRELSPSSYAFEAQYGYTISGRNYFGRSVLKTPTFPNRFAAESYENTLLKKRATVWFEEKDPSCSSLEKVFPKKSLIHSLLTLAVFVYFYFAKTLLLKFL